MKLKINNLILRLKATNKLLKELVKTLIYVKYIVFQVRVIVMLIVTTAVTLSLLMSCTNSKIPSVTKKVARQQRMYIRNEILLAGE